MYSFWSKIDWFYYYICCCCCNIITIVLIHLIFYLLMETEHEVFRLPLTGNWKGSWVRSGHSTTFTWTSAKLSSSPFCNTATRDKYSQLSLQQYPGSCSLQYHHSWTPLPPRSSSKLGTWSCTFSVLLQGSMTAQGAGCLHSPRTRNSQEQETEGGAHGKDWSADEIVPTPHRPFRV